MAMMENKQFELGMPFTLPDDKLQDFIHFPRDRQEAGSQLAYLAESGIVDF